MRQLAIGANMENNEKYRAFTRDGNWSAICDLNGVKLDSFGAKKELRVLSKYLENDEIVYALTAGMMTQTKTSNEFDFGANTWLIVLTSERFLLLDHALLTSSVDTQSIRLDRVQAVSASQGWVLGKIMIDLGSRMVTVDNCQKATVSPIADLANKLLREKENSGQNAQPNDLIEKIGQLAELHRLGALTDDEFSRAKEKLLS